MLSNKSYYSLMESTIAARKTGFMLQHLSAILEKQSDQILQEKHGIGFSQFKILMALYKDSTKQQRYIAAILGQTEASVSRQIKIMKDMGLLHTSINPENKREHRTAPTKKGIDLTKAAKVTLTRFHAPMFNSLQPKQREQLFEMLTILHAQACQPGKEFACHQPVNK
ncbi:MAG: hypothetical protein NVSMB46_04450 [Candidatus Saccharimonadales bacterium]